MEKNALCGGNLVFHLTASTLLCIHKRRHLSAQEFDMPLRTLKKCARHIQLLFSHHIFEGALFLGFGSAFFFFFVINFECHLYRFIDKIHEYMTKWGLMALTSYFKELKPITGNCLKYSSNLIPGSGNSKRVSYSCMKANFLLNFYAALATSSRYWSMLVTKTCGSHSFTKYLGFLNARTSETTKQERGKYLAVYFVKDLLVLAVGSSLLLK